MDVGLKQLKVISRGKTVAGSEFQSLEIIWILLSLNSSELESNDMSGRFLSTRLEIRQH